MRITFYSSFVLIISLLLAAACQSAGDPVATGSIAPSQTQVPQIESTGRIDSGSKSNQGTPRPAASEPIPSGTAELSNRSGGTETGDPATQAREQGQTVNSPQPTSSTPSISPPVRGGRIVVGALSSVDTLHPLLAETEAGRAIVPLLFDSLSAYDPNSGQLAPRLAEDWSIAPDSRTITFTLRADALWHDAQPVSADDVVYSIETARDPALDSLYGPPLGHVTEVSAPDDRTVVIHLDAPHCPTLAALGELPIIPQHALTGTDLDTVSFGSDPLGSGPFMFVDWTDEGEVRLARNDDYWGNVPYLDALSYRPFETVAELQGALESEEIDVAWMLPGSLPGITYLSPTLSVYQYPTPEFLFVAFNNVHPVLSDTRVRQALSMAVDRKGLVDQVLGGAAELVAGSLPATHWAANSALEPPAHDPDGARKLLAEAGWSDSDGDGWLDRDGERLRLPVRTNGGNQLREDVATLVADYYRAIGIDAPVELVVWGAVVDDLFTHDFEAIVFSWPLSPEPDQSRWWLSTEDEIGRGFNFVSFAEEAVDDLLNEGLTVPGCEPGRRADLYQRVQGVLAHERPYDFLFIPYATLLARPDLHGLEAGPFAGPLDHAARWYLVP